MSLAPLFTGKTKMSYPLKYMLVLTDNQEGEQGEVLALFTDKTHADKCANELNVTIGRHGNLYAVCKLFSDIDRSK